MVESSNGRWRKVLSSPNWCSLREKPPLTRRMSMQVRRLKRRVEAWPSSTREVCPLISQRILSQTFTTSLPLKTARFTAAQCHILSNTLTPMSVTRAQSTKLDAVRSGTRTIAQFSWPAHMTGLWESGTLKIRISQSLSAIRLSHWSSRWMISVGHLTHRPCLPRLLTTAALSCGI